MELLSLGLVVAGCVLLVWFIVSATLANSMIRSGRYNKVTLSMVPLFVGAALVFLGVGLGLMTW